MFRAWSAFWSNRARKRREEKTKRSQHIEETFSERLASRSVAGKSSSKIDVGFTSQQTINQDSEGRERKPTFSRFLKLWKGLRNSKRKPATTNDERRTSVVFTIPTKDSFPQSSAKQQTFLPNSFIQTNGQSKTQMFEVHREAHHVNEEYKNADTHQPNDDLDTIRENEMHPDEGVTETSHIDCRSTESTILVGEKGNTPDRKTRDENFLKGKEEGKSFSKESDVDSGCGSSCHEIYSAEPPITHAQLNVSSLVHCHAQKMDAIDNYQFADKVSGHSLVDQVLRSSPPSMEKNILHKTKRKLCDGEVEKRRLDDELREFKKSQDSFEELINLAKDGMSTLARKQVDHGDKKKSILDCFQDISTDDAQQNKGQNLDSRAESELCLDTQEVDSGIKGASFISSCLNDTDSTTEVSRCNAKENKSDSTANITLHCSFNDKQSDRILTTKKHPKKPMDKTSQCLTTEKQSSKLEAAKISNNVAKEQSDIPTGLATYEVKIPIITFESNSQTTNNSVGTGEHSVVLSSHDDQNVFCRDSQELNNDQHKQGNSNAENETSSNSSHQAEALTKKHVTLQIQENLLRNEQLPETSSRPKSLVILSTQTNDSDNKTVHGLKVPSLETLDFPSHRHTTEDGSRIRSFSATIRRKLSFREEVSSDGSHIEKQDTVIKNKKILGFRSFRVNRKKKTKAFKSNELSQSTGCLSDSKKYSSTIDKIFQENTSGAIFTDVPFTIPEISE